MSEQRHVVLNCLEIVLSCETVVLFCRKLVSSCPNVILVCYDTVVLCYTVVLSCPNVILTCLNTFTFGRLPCHCVPIRCFLAKRMSFMSKKHAVLTNCGGNLSRNCLIMWNRNVILSELGVNLSNSCLIMSASSDILFNRYIDLAKCCPVLSNCFVSLYEVVLFCLIVTKHHAVLSKSVVILPKNILFMWNTNVDLPINLVCLCKRYFINVKQYCRKLSSKDDIDMSKHCHIFSDRHAILSKLYVNRP
jgi:hypothetical protein